VLTIVVSDMTSPDLKPHTASSVKCVLPCPSTSDLRSVGRSATMSWCTKQHAKNIGSGIVSYKVRSAADEKPIDFESLVTLKESNAQQEAIVDARCTLVLCPGMKYRFQVCATNASGEDGYWSPAKGFVETEGTLKQRCCSGQ
jgi:hypothetical protein